jgi:hypothetical protein
MIFITGASSFVGRTISLILEKEGVSYNPITRIQLYDNLDKFLKLNECDILIHCAWAMDYKDVNNRDKNETLNNEVLKAIDSVKKIIFISSIHSLNLNDVYSQDKRKWENRFSFRVKKNNKKISTIYLPHLISPEEIGINNNSVIYKFYTNWKVGALLEVHNDKDIFYTDLESFKEVLLQSMMSDRFTRIVPKYSVSLVSQIKADFLSDEVLCPIIKQLKDSDLIKV